MNANASWTRGDAHVAPDPFSTFVVALTESAVFAAAHMRAAGSDLFDSALQAAAEARRRFRYHRTMATLSAVSDHVLNDIGCDRGTLYLLTRLSGEGCEAGLRHNAAAMA